MAGSRYTYVKGFELPDPLLPSTFFVIRIDGKGFHGFSKAHNFDKPNDWNALTLMNEAAKRVVGGRELNGECVMAFGESDEYSFVFKRSCKLHGRRSSKLVTLVVSVFTAAYVALWPQYFPNSPLKLEELPVFDGRVVQYTNEAEVRDYLRWRQVDTHINNMYNTVFWALVLQGGRTPVEAEQELSGTISSQKQEILFSQFGINYNNLEPMYRKGSLVIWEEGPPTENAPASTVRALRCLEGVGAVLRQPILAGRAVVFAFNISLSRLRSIRQLSVNQLYASTGQDATTKEACQAEAETGRRARRLDQRCVVGEWAREGRTRRVARCQRNAMHRLNIERDRASEGGTDSRRCNFR
ncbi:tRNAHis guanylyltransferase-domain-containing protein [Rhodotorula toruloides]